MAEKKPGPVKPPIIDAKPRTSDKAVDEKQSPKPQTGTASSSTEKPQTTKPDPTPKTQSSEPDAAPPLRGAARPLPLGPLIVAAGAGALIGLGLAYGLASYGFWPQANDSRALAGIQARTTRLEDASALQQSETAQFATRLDAIEGRLTDIQAREPAATEGLTAQIAELSTRVDAIAAGASGQEASALVDNLSGLSNQLGTLTERVDALDARIADQADFDAVAAERDRVAQIPGALGALETAIATGEPFAAQLAELETLLPTLEISQEARAAAASGITPQAQLLSEFRATIPAILAAVPVDESAGWAETLLGQAASTLALRPTEGNSPQALVGRTEAAIASGDLDAAQTAFAALPEPMRAAAPSFAEALSRTLAANTLLDAARAADPISASAEGTQ